eukprot:RCo027958
MTHLLPGLLVFTSVLVSMCGGQTVSVPLTSEGGKVYVNLTLGTPGVTVTAVVDTGSAMLYSFLYNHSASTTAKPLHKSGWANYSKTTVYGQLVSDEVTIGPSSSFTKVLLQPYKSGNMSLVGFSWPGWASGGQCVADTLSPGTTICGGSTTAAVPVMQSMYKQNLIGQNLFGMWVEMTGEGGLMLGGIDSEKVDGEITYTPVLPNVLRKDFQAGINVFWQFTLQQVTLVLPNGQKKTLCCSSCIAIVDSGTGTIRAPNSPFNAIKQAFTTFASCNVTLVFTIENTDFAIKYTSCTAQSMFTTLPDSVLLNPEAKNIWWTLGLPFVSQFYIVHDFANTRIGFANLAQTEAVEVAVL